MLHGVESAWRYHCDKFKTDVGELSNVTKRFLVISVNVKVQPS